MKRSRLGHAVYGEVAQNVATLRTSLFYAAAFESHLGEFFHIKEFRAAQMIVSLFDPRIDAAHVDLCTELRELSVSCAQELMHAETDRRARRIESVCLIRQYGGTQASD